MHSRAVSFELEFPARRLLQQQVRVTVANPSTDAFQLRLRAAVAAELAPVVAESSIIITTTSSARVLQITILESRDVVASQLATQAASDRFVSGVSTRLATIAVMRTAPSVIMRVTSVPSPPPSMPPSPSTNLDQANSLGAANASNDTAGQQVIWLIIGGGLALVFAAGCLIAYCLGKRSSKSTAVVGRPALRRHGDEQAALEQAPPSAQPNTAVTNVRVDDLRLLELGMAVQRAQTSTSTVAPVAANDIALKLDGVQAAIDIVRENLSPRKEQQLSPRLTDTRIVRTSASLGP